ncbi:MAG: LysR family transcriptional regulator [Burkholderiaceae bacterium]|nr:LysR family transcriptional regulator [Burkholderiaceae bacterium]
MDLEWIEVFNEVYKSGSVSRTADNLGISQAAASNALKKLRDYFGDPLFARTARGMSPTPRCQRIFPALQDIAYKLAQVRDSVLTFDPASAQRTFRICLTDVSEVVVLPQILDYIGLHAPHVKIETEIISSSSAQRLADGEVDIAVGYMPRLQAGFYQQVLSQQDFVCLVSKNHPRIGHRLSAKAFIAEGHTVVSSSVTEQTIVAKALARMGIERRNVVSLTGFLATARIVAHSDLIAVVPRALGEVITVQRPVRLMELPFTLPGYSVKQYWHKRFHADPACIWLRRLIAQLAGDGVARRSNAR